MTACSYPPPYRLRCRSAVRCLRRKALPCVTARCAVYRVFLRKTRVALRQKPQKFAVFSAFSPSRLFQQKFFQSLKNLVFGLQKCVRTLLHRSAMRCLRLFVCSQCSHFVARQSLAYRVFLRKTRAFCGKKHKNSRFFFTSLVCALLAWCDFVESADALRFPEAFPGKVRAHFACSACFWGKCGRILLPRSVFGESADAFCLLGVFLEKVRAHFVSQRVALLTEFLGSFRHGC